MAAVPTMVRHLREEASARSKEQAQAGVVRFLKDPATLGGEPVRHIVTHISHIFLAGRYAWKLKRAVKLPFVDFSTLARRKAACENELRLNRRTAPELYLSVQPITRDKDGRLAISGGGTPVDWLVQMQRFDDGALLSEIADAGKLTGEIIDQLGDQLVAFHNGCEVRRDVGGYQTLSRVLDGLGETLSGARIAGVSARDLRNWQVNIEARLEVLGPVLDARARRGLVRHCHGDMHLENIVLLDGQPVPFDAIEFSDRIATTDVLYDLAFPVMDLMSRGEVRLANRLMNRYLAATGAYSGLAAWSLFLSIRAAIRAAVVALKGEDGRTPTAQQYFALAKAVLKRPHPELFAVGGLSGSGKSTLANAVAPELGAQGGAVILSSDVMRKRMFDARPEGTLPETAYHGAVSAMVYERISQCAGSALLAGTSVVADATFLRAEDRKAIETVAVELGLPFTGYWLDIPPDELRARVVRRNGVGASDAGLDVLERQLAEDPGEMTWRRIGQEEARNAVPNIIGAPRASLAG